MERCAWNTVEDERERKILSARPGPSKAFGRSISFGHWRIDNWNGKAVRGREGAYLWKGATCEMWEVYGKYQEVGDKRNRWTGRKLEG